MTNRPAQNLLRRVQGLYRFITAQLCKKASWRSGVLLSLSVVIGIGAFLSNVIFVAPSSSTPSFISYGPDGYSGGAAIPACGGSGCVAYQGLSCSCGGGTYQCDGACSVNSGSSCTTNNNDPKIWLVSNYSPFSDSRNSGSNSVNVPFNSSVTINWNAPYASYCDVTAYRATGITNVSSGPTSGAVSSGALGESVTYGIYCYNNINPPGAIAYVGAVPAIWADSNNLPNGGSTNVNWNAQYANSCKVDKLPDSGGRTTVWYGSSGAQNTGALTQGTTYELACESWATNTYVSVSSCTPAPPQSSGTLTTTGTIGIPFNYTFGVTGTVTSASPTGTLPPGVQLTSSLPSASYTLSGTPTQPGIYTYGITASNSCGINTQWVEITIAGQCSPGQDSAAGSNGAGDGVTVTSLSNPVYFQAVRAMLPFDVEHFKIGADDYVALATRHNGTWPSGAATSTPIFKWIPSRNCFGDGDQTCDAWFDYIPTNGPLTVKHFTVNGVHYLLAGSDIEAPSTNYMYQWMPNENCFGNGATCHSVYQQIPANRTIDVEPFSVGGEQYVAIANYVTTTTDYTPSYFKVYRWLPGGTSGCPSGGGLGNATQCANASTDNAYQSISMHGVFRLRFFSFGGSNYLVAGQNKNLVANQMSNVYKWLPGGTSGCPTDGGFGGLTQCGANQFVSDFPTNVVQGIEFFQLEGEGYLGVGNYYGGSSYIYKWMPSENPPCFGSGSVCDSRITGGDIPSSNPFNFEHFTVGLNHYLALTNITGSVSPIYKWSPSGGCFGNGSVSGCGQTYQSIPTSSATNWDYFEIGNKQYLMVSNLGATSKLYRWTYGTWTAGTSACTSPSNSCGQYSTGIRLCGGACSVTVPPSENGCQVGPTITTIISDTSNPSRTTAGSAGPGIVEDTLTLLIRPGGSCQISWQAAPGESCTINGLPKVLSDSYTTPALLRTTSYLLSCTNGGEETIQRNICRVVPDYVEK